MAKIYDPLGFLGPIITKAKLIMQKLWLAKLSWDDCLTTDLNNKWREYYNSLVSLPIIEINRNFKFSEAKSINLFGFCDASYVAYGCCIYFRVVIKDNMVYVNSKSRNK